jgi:prepilin-type N-terminal cleavage/methylation domain-containing protein
MSPEPLIDRRRRRVRVRHVGGFTLLELTVSLFIIGLLASLVAPRFAQVLAANRVEMAARRIAADLRRVQETARITSTSMVVRFVASSASSRYEAPGLPDLDHRGGRYEVRLYDDPYRAEITAASFGGDAEVAFDGHGRPDSGGTVTVGIGKHVRTVTIDGNGRATIAASKI